MGDDLAALRARVDELERAAEAMRQTLVMYRVAFDSMALSSDPDGLVPPAATPTAPRISPPTSRA